MYGYIDLNDQVVGAFILISLFGIPHGAIDNIIFLSKNNMSSLLFYILYIFSILTYCLSWFIFPLFSLIFFLLLSAYHFGESQMSDYTYFNISKNVIYSVWGTFIISSLVYYNIDELLILSKQSSDMIQFEKIFNVILFKYIFYCSNFILFIILIYESVKHSISFEQLLNEMFQILLIHITFILFPIVISFTLYFIFLHSLKVLKQEYDYLFATMSNLTLFRFIKLLIPHTSISIFSLIIFLIIIEAGYLDVSLFLFSIIGISVITLPHAIIMSNFYHKK